MFSLKNDNYISHSAMIFFLITKDENFKLYFNE